MNLPKLYVDVSELFYRSTFKYYGISTVVNETARQFSQINPDTKFVVFSHLQKRFFEIVPRIGEAAPNGIFDLNLKQAPAPARMRNRFRRRLLESGTGFLLERGFAKVINLARCYGALRSAKEADLNGGVMIAMGRPRIMSDYVRALNRNGCTVKFYPLLHDLIPLHDLGRGNATGFSTKFLNDNIAIVEFSAGIIANSEFTRGELQRFSKNGLLPPLPPTFTVQLALEHSETGEVPYIELPKAPYLLCVGGSTGRKNLEVVFDAMCELDRRREPVPNLVLAGAARRRLREYLKQPKYKYIRKNVRYIVDPNKTDLARLYRNARALVIPSHMEGWGLPAGEALWHGTPVISSTAPALKEVGGDLALYFDPNNEKELASHIHRLMTDNSYHSELKNTIAKQRHVLRRWRDFALDVLQVVETS